MSQIVIGGLGNTKSMIRRDTHKENLVEKDTPEALSEDEFRGFWIKFLDGTIRVGKEKEVKFKYSFHFNTATNTICLLTEVLKECYRKFKKNFI